MRSILTFATAVRLDPQGNGKDGRLRNVLGSTGCKDFTRKLLAFAVNKRYSMRNRHRERRDLTGEILHLMLAKNTRQIIRTGTFGTEYADVATPPDKKAMCGIQHMAFPVWKVERMQSIGNEHTTLFSSRRNR